MAQKGINFDHTCGTITYGEVVNNSNTAETTGDTVVNFGNALKIGDGTSNALINPETGKIKEEGLLKVSYDGDTQKWYLYKSNKRGDWVQYAECENLFEEMLYPLILG